MTGKNTIGPSQIIVAIISAIMITTALFALAPSAGATGSTAGNAPEEPHGAAGTTYVENILIDNFVITDGGDVLEKAGTAGLSIGDNVYSFLSSTSSGENAVMFVDNTSTVTTGAYDNNDDILLITRKRYGTTRDDNFDSETINAFPTDVVYGAVGDGYQDNEAIIKNVSGTNTNLEATDNVIFTGFALLTDFSSSTKFVDSDHDGSIYRNGDAIVRTSDNTLSSGDTIVTDGTLGSMADFDAGNVRYTDNNGNSAYDNNEAIIDSSTNATTLEPGEVLVSGGANLRSFDDNDYVTDFQNTGSYDSGEAIWNFDTTAAELANGDSVVRSGRGKLRNFGSGTLAYSDNGTTGESFDLSYDAVWIENASGIDGQFDSGVDILVNNPTGSALNDGATGHDITTDNEIVYLDSNGDASFDFTSTTCEPVVHLGDGVTVADKGDLPTSTTVLDNQNPGAVTKHIDDYTEQVTQLSSLTINYPEDGTAGYDGTEAVIDASTNSAVLESGEVLTSGTANITGFANDQSKYIDANNNGSFETNEAIVSPDGGAADYALESADTIVRAGLADLTKFDNSGTPRTRFVDQDESTTYNDGEAILRDSGTLGKLDQTGLLNTGTENVITDGTAGCLSEFSSVGTSEGGKGGKGYMFVENDTIAGFSSEDEILKITRVSVDGGAPTLDGATLYDFADNQKHGGSGLYSDSSAIIEDGDTNEVYRDVLTGLTATNDLTNTAVENAQVSAVELWGDNGDGNFESGTDTNLGSFTWDNSENNWDITGLSVDISALDNRFFVTMDVASSVTSTYAMKGKVESITTYGTEFGTDTIDNFTNANAQYVTGAPMDKDFYETGKEVKVTIYDNNKNSDDADIEDFTITIRSDSETAGDDLQLTETSASSGVFEGRISLDGEPGEAGLYVQDDDLIWFTYGGSTVTDSAIVDDKAPIVENLLATKTVEGQFIKPVATDLNVDILENNGWTAEFSQDDNNFENLTGTGDAQPTDNVTWDGTQYADGSYDFSVTVTDNYGHTNSASLTLIVDNTAPQVTNPAADPAIIDNEESLSIELSVDVTDNVFADFAESGVSSVEVDVAPLQYGVDENYVAMSGSGNGTYTYTLAAENINQDNVGTYDLTVEATDNMGEASGWDANVDNSTSITVDVIEDDTNPVLENVTVTYPSGQVDEVKQGQTITVFYLVVLGSDY
ncbi:hypothetical protein AKJ65_01495 [candidate division MSBL1 archaeon SCGC-AAA259E19]|uniref:Uncharacterized protein n=1 Tax=candidate division MSBL1 archaeon SCGC-AAA259E19 TaxID=1698264 RepID=A0A133UN28_9EURY|nr:hypothetical protein AKJ65_01495 [candidate division MSBL1 archaeon SCGC-AAA259E19]